MRRFFRRAARASATAVGLLLSLATFGAATAAAQGAAESAAFAPARSDTALALDEAIARAVREHPSLAAARAEVAAAAAAGRQAAAYENPTFSFQREATSASGVRNSQNIVTLDQPIDLGVRRARYEGAVRRQAAAEARLRHAESQLSYEVTAAYAQLAASQQRTALANQAAAAFQRATATSAARLAAGDIAGYAHRRLRLEAARYLAISAEESFARFQAVSALASLLGDTLRISHGAYLRVATLDEMLSTHGSRISGVEVGVTLVDSLTSSALARRADLAAVRADADALRAEARVASRARLPMPTLTAGLKTESAAGLGTLKGYAAGIAMPLPLWDRQRGMVTASTQLAAASDARTALLARGIRFEVAVALSSLVAVRTQLSALEAVHDDVAKAMTSAESAYAEGEISLLEWLDAVRATVETETRVTALQAETIIRRAALDRAVGQPNRSIRP